HLSTSLRAKFCHPVRCRWTPTRTVVSHPSFRRALLCSTSITPDVGWRIGSRPPELPDDVAGEYSRITSGAKADVGIRGNVARSTFAHDLRYTLAALKREEEGCVFDHLTDWSAGFLVGNKDLDWRLGATAVRAYLGKAEGKPVVVFIAKEGRYRGKIVGSVVPDAKQFREYAEIILKDMGA
ncbi:MAG: hypothetical protein WBQ14_08810, partial [Gaiellaceae bacterium]